MDHPDDGKKYKILTNRLVNPKRFQHYILRVVDGKELKNYTITSICRTPPRFLMASAKHLNCFGEYNSHKIPPQETDKHLLSHRKPLMRVRQQTVQSWLGRII